MTARLLIGISALALLAGCGDDLESRQAAVQERMPDRDMSGTQSQPQETRLSITPAPAATAEGFADDGEINDEDEGAVVEATPEALIDDAQGFSTAPIDDTSGFDPSPNDGPQGFAPEPIEPEAFDE